MKNRITRSKMYGILAVCCFIGMFAVFLAGPLWTDILGINGPVKHVAITAVTLVVIWIGGIATGKISASD